ncbi:MAG: FAD:protein FMN transferase [Gammaproteobacteria bacterium]
MGTSYSVKLVSNENTVNKEKLQHDIEQILTDINQSMSTYIADSELSKLNQNKSGLSQNISDSLFYVIEQANNISGITNGAFDITVGPLVNLWGFGPDPFTQKVPEQAELNSVKQHTGFEKLQLNKTTSSISKSDPDVYIDLSGIAKGYAVDMIAKHLEKNKCEHYLVEIGGELIAKGLNAEGVIWQIGIEQAIAEESAIQQNSAQSVAQSYIQRIISLNNIAMATSGDYRNYFEKDGVRYSHTIDPRTGKPVSHTLASVTVLDKSTMIADAMATAFMVMGTEKTHALANELKMPVYTIAKTENGFAEKYNDYFKTYLSEE